MLLTMAFRNIFRKPFRSLLSLATIMMAVFGMTFLFSVIGGLRDDMANNIKDYSSGDLAIKHMDAEKYERQNPLGFKVNGSEETLAQLEALEGVDYALPRIPFSVLISRDGKNKAFQGLALDFAREDSAWKLNSFLVNGTVPNPDSNEIVMAQSLANSLGLKIDDRFTFMTTTGRRTSNAVTLKIVDLAHFDLPAWNTNYFLMDISRAKGFLQMDESVVEILLRGDKPSEVLQSTVAEAGLFGEEVVLNRWDKGTSFMTILPWQN
jgi:ABC-type lipoprotein release transport system permease subunit